MKESKNSDKRQWIPAYGMYQAYKDLSNGKPNLLLDTTCSKMGLGYMIYQSISFGALFFGLHIGLERLLH